jgi:hypothetical protein
MPIREHFKNTTLNIVLPHENSDKAFNSKEFFKNCDLVIAEVSKPSTGLGIELGWADLLDIPIFCLNQKDYPISGSLKVISNHFYTYETSNELIKIINNILNKMT